MKAPSPSRTSTSKYSWPLQKPTSQSAFSLEPLLSSHFPIYANPDTNFQRCGLERGSAPQKDKEKHKEKDKDKDKEKEKEKEKEKKNRPSERERERARASSLLYSPDR